MKGIISIIYLLSITVAIHARTRIYGGFDAPEGKYPYQVSLRRWDHFCGGSIINERWILTAAHCLQGKEAETIKVVVGTILRAEGNGRAYQAEKIFHHKGYTNETLQNDIGLVRVNEDIKFNSKVQPIKLPEKDTTKVDQSAVVTGWGLVAAKKNSDKLQYLVAKIFNQANCNKKMAHEVIDSHICTFTKKGEGFCAGDSGGPLVIDGVQIGVVSYDKGCGKGNPDVFTRVYSFKDWIDNTMSRN